MRQTSALICLIVLISCTITFGIMVYLGVEIGSAGLGQPHPTLPAMRAGSDPALTVMPYHTLISTCYFLCLVTISALITLSFPEPRRTLKVIAFISAPAIISFLCWLGMMSGYLNYVTSGDVEYLWGFPSATTLMLLAPWIAVVLYCAVFVYLFDSEIFTDEDARKFEALLAQEDSGDT